MADLPSSAETRVEVVCLACGSTISKATERRNICNTSEVISLWKSFLKREMERRKEVSIYECAFTDRGEIKTNKGIQKNICRKCYYLLEKLLKCEEVCTHKILAKI